jgi:hypothetical protein
MSFASNKLGIPWDDCQMKISGTEKYDNMKARI